MAVQKAVQSKKSSSTKEKWFDLGTLRKNEAGKSYIVLDKNVEISVGGKTLDLGDYRTLRLTDPYSSLDGLLESGHITEDEHAQRKDAMQQRNVKFKVTLPPPGRAEDSE